MKIKKSGNRRDFEKILKEVEDNEAGIKYNSKIEKNFKNIAYAYPTLTNCEDNYLIRKYIKTKDPRIKDVLFKCHLRDVYEMCYDKTGLKIDLISEGYTLLYQVIDLYDPKDYKNVPFRTYIRMFLATKYEREIANNAKEFGVKAPKKSMKKYTLSNKKIKLKDE